MDGDVAVTALPSAKSTNVDSSEVNESLVGPSPAISVETEPAEAQPPDNDSYHIPLSIKKPVSPGSLPTLTCLFVV